MTTKRVYLKEYTRDLCRDCKFWVPWHYDRKGKKVFGCKLGEIPYQNECRYFSRRR